MRGFLDPRYLAPAEGVSLCGARQQCPVSIPNIFGPVQCHALNSQRFNEGKGHWTPVSDAIRS
jgi:hypothetical protein